MRSLAWLRKCPNVHLKPRRPPLKHGRDYGLRRLAAQANTIYVGSEGRGKDRIRWSRIFWLYVPITTFGLATTLTYRWYTTGDDKGSLNLQEFTFYTLVSKEPVSSTSSLFTLRPIADKDNASIYAEAWRKGIWSVQIKQPQLQIARSYTPLPSSKNDEGSSNNDLRFLIRWEPHGEVSGYLHQLPLDASIEIRGPQMEYEIPEDVENVVFLAGGTGIAPALQMVHTLFERRSSLSKKSSKIQILWANRRQEDALDQPVQSSQASNAWSSWLTKSAPAEIEKPKDAPYATSLLTDEIKLLKARHAHYLSLHYFVDEQKTFINETVLSQYLKDSTRKETSSSTAQSGQTRRLIVVSGPEGFVNHLAGSKIWKGGKECQGPLGGLLGKLDTGGWDVQKL